MKRLLLDTNIYGEMVIDLQIGQLRDRFDLFKQEFVIYGLQVIRKELRATSKISRMIDGKGLRMALLSLYDYFTQNRELSINLEKTKDTVEKYYELYRKFGGSRGKEEMFNDFFIVACASQNNLDIVVSNDDMTMLTENALKAYDALNHILGWKRPEFIDYKKFKNLLGVKTLLR